MADQMLHQANCQTVTADNASDEPGTFEPSLEARKRRITSLRHAAGIWADRTDIPADGLQYEREMRNEWQ